MENVHRLSLMVLTVLTAAFLAVDLPLMAQMGGQQRRGQQGAPQQPKGAQQGAPKGAGTAQIDKSSPKLTPQQEQRVKQLQQQAQSLFRNLKQVLGELQQGPATQTNDIDPHDDGNWIAGKPNPQGPQQRPGQQRAGNSNSLAQSNQAPALALSLKIDGLKKQAQQIVNNFEVIENEAKSLGFTKQNFTILQSGASTFAPQQLQQMGEELKEFGVAVPAASWIFQEGAKNE